MSFVNTNYYVEELPVWPEARTAQPQTATNFSHSIMSPVLQPPAAGAPDRHPLTPTPFPDACDTSGPNAPAPQRPECATATATRAVAYLTAVKNAITTQLNTIGGLLPAATTTLTTVAPATGPLAGSTPLTLTGTGFVAPVTVSIGGRNATSVVIVSATSVTCKAPAGSLAGVTGVTVTGANGNAYKAASYTYT